MQRSDRQIRQIGQHRHEQVARAREGSGTLWLEVEKTLGAPSSTDGNHPFHMGDLINIAANDGGLGLLTTQTTCVMLSPGPLSIFEPNGKASSAFIVHTDPDSYCPDG